MMILTPHAGSLPTGYGQAARLLRPGLVDPKLSPPASEGYDPPEKLVRTPADVVDGLPLAGSERTAVMAAVDGGKAGYTVASHLRRVLVEHSPSLIREVVGRASRLAQHVRASTPREPRAALGMAAALGLRKSGGPFIGPHGGKWADAAHTVAWKDDPIHVAKIQEHTEAEARYRARGGKSALAAADAHKAAAGAWRDVDKMGGYDRNPYVLTAAHGRSEWAAQQSSVADDVAAKKAATAATAVQPVATPPAAEPTHSGVSPTAPAMATTTTHGTKVFQTRDGGWKVGELVTIRGVQHKVVKRTPRYASASHAEDMGDFGGAGWRVSYETQPVQPLQKSGVVKIGPHGGQIIGYAHGDQKRPIYAGKNPEMKRAHVYPVGSGPSGVPVDVPVHDVHGPYAWTGDPAIAGGKPAVVHLPTGRVVSAVTPGKAAAGGPKATASAAVKALDAQHGAIGLDAAPGGFTSKADYQTMRSVVAAHEQGTAAPSQPSSAPSQAGKGAGSTAIVQHTANPIANAFLTEVDHLFGGKAEPLASGTLTHVQKLQALAASGGSKPLPAVATPPDAGAPPPLDKAAALHLVDKIAFAINMPHAEVRAALMAPDAGPKNGHVAQARARIEGAIMKLGMARPHAVLELLDGGHHTQAQVDARIEAIGSGDKAALKKEYAATPVYDLHVLKSARADAKPVQGGAYCTHDRDVVMGKGEDGKYVTGNFRHELGHAVMMSWGYHSGAAAPAGTPAVAILAHYKAAKAAMNAAGKPPAGGFSHEWYETNAGVIGSRALDNAHEDAAEHYRGYHREVLRHRFKGGGQLDTYRARHPEMAAMWDARYTAALLASAASKGVW